MNPPPPYKGGSGAPQYLENKIYRDDRAPPDTKIEQTVTNGLVLNNRKFGTKYYDLSAQRFRAYRPKSNFQ